MTYLSYYRAKQNELLALVEKADLISQKNIIPILEPVNLTYKPIAKACKKLNDKDCNFIIIANSTVGKCYIESPDHVNHIKEIASKNTENKIGLLIDPSKFEIKNYLISLPFIKNLI
ncbi:sce7725 family protein [Comamonas aquatica]|uniref:sce7725 family protein n=1 Tax=Comamonas aquatica TaxID=225991 RepID=UPI002448C89A|nr:sce7725 family protein [Comamonas aquatica]MDH0899608.1 sce7725 family protein [Comamonas aquatica]